MDRVTITLPSDLVQAIDRADNNRSGFLARAARKELRRLARAAFVRSLDERVFTGEDAQLEAAGLAEYAAQLPDDDLDAMIAPDAFAAVRWAPGTGWTEGKR